MYAFGATSPHVHVAAATPNPYHQLAALDGGAYAHSLKQGGMVSVWRAGAQRRECESVGGTDSSGCEGLFAVPTIQSTHAFVHPVVRFESAKQCVCLHVCALCVLMLCTALQCAPPHHLCLNYVPEPGKRTFRPARAGNSGICITGCVKHIPGRFSESRCFTGGVNTSFPLLTGSEV